MRTERNCFDCVLLPGKDCQINVRSVTKRIHFYSLLLGRSILFNEMFASKIKQFSVRDGVF